MAPPSHVQLSVTFAAAGLACNWVLRPLWVPPAVAGRPHLPVVLGWGSALASRATLGHLQEVAVALGTLQPAWRCLFLACLEEYSAGSSVCQGSGPACCMQPALGRLQPCMGSQVSSR